MKLIYCNTCKDIIRLYKTTSTCQCGDSGGHYQADGLNAIIYGNCKPLGFTNTTFTHALDDQPDYGKGSEFTAFVIPANCPTVDHVDSEDYESISGYTYYNIDDELMDQVDLDIIKDKKKKIKNVFKDEK